MATYESDIENSMLKGSNDIKSSKSLKKEKSLPTDIKKNIVANGLFDKFFGSAKISNFDCSNSGRYFDRITCFSYAICR